MEQTIIWMLKKKYLEVLTHQKDFEEFYKQTRKRNYVSARHSRTIGMLMSKNLLNIFSNIDPHSQIWISMKNWLDKWTNCITDKQERFQFMRNLKEKDENLVMLYKGWQLSQCNLHINCGSIGCISLSWSLIGSYAYSRSWSSRSSSSSLIWKNPTWIRTFIILLLMSARKCDVSINLLLSGSFSLVVLTP